MSRIIDRLRELKTPPEFSREQAEQTWQLFTQGLLGELQEQQPFLKEIIDILQSAELEQFINEGKITLAMIKPRLHESVIASNIPGIEDDPALAEFFTRQIKPPLKVIFSFSSVMSGKFVDKFYSGPPKERQLNKPPMDRSRYGLNLENRWQEAMAHLTGGPTTFLLLHSEYGQAIECWRDQMGYGWNIDEVRNTQRNSIRAKYCFDNHNTLLHGSDSPESAQREISLLVDFLEQFVSKGYNIAPRHR